MPQDTLQSDPTAPRFPLAENVPFGSFQNRYAGQGCHVVGRGPTEFDYQQLANVTEPVFFINDAVCMEKYVRTESFLFAHDPHIRVWLNGEIKSTPVLPIDGKVFRDAPGITLNHAGKIVFYHWRELNREELLYMNRDQIAEIRQLYTHTGTIHSLLHFAWFCGFTKITFIGCDCITNTSELSENLRSTDGYDPRLQNRTRPAPSTTYPAIGRAQALLCTLFGFETNYVGTPGKK